MRLADTAMNRIWVDDGNPPGIPAKWTYEHGGTAKAIYTDGRKLPADFQNFQAAQELSAWLLSKAKGKR